MAHHPLDPFDVPGEPFGGGEGVSASLVEQLTQAIQDLTGRLQTGAGMPGTSAGAGTPWWFAYKQSYPGAPESPPPGSAAARDSGWWGRYTDPGAEDFTYVRSYFRRKAVPRPEVPMAPGMAPGVSPAAPAAAQALASSGYPEWVMKVASQTGENPADIAGAFGIKGAGGGASRAVGGGGGRGKPPWWSAFTNASPDPPGGGDPGRGRRGEPWWGKYFRSAGNAVPPPPTPTVTAASFPWNRQRRRHPWHWNTTRRVAGFARLVGGKRAGRMAMAGMSAAAQRFAFSGNLASAARVGVMGGAAAGGPMTVGVVALGMAAVKAAEALQRMTTEQLAYNRELAKASPSMALVFAERDVQERLRQREMGERLAPSARGLSQAEQATRQATKDLEVLWEKVKNETATAWEGFKTGALAGTGPISQFLEGVLEGATGGGGGGGDAVGFTEYVRDIARDDAEARKRKDKRWEPPQLHRDRLNG